MLAIEPCDCIGRAQRVLEPFSDFHEQRVASRMAQTVVDHLEAVEVEKQHGKRLAPRCLTVRQHAIEPIDEEHPIGQPGQGVRTSGRDLGANPGKRDGKIDWLGDIVVCSQIQGFDDVLALILCGDHDHRQIRDRPQLSQLPQRLEATHAGHHHVEQDGIDSMFTDHPERGAAALSGQDRIAAARQPPRQRVPIHRVIVDQQQRCTRL